MQGCLKLEPGRLRSMEGLCVGGSDCNASTVLQYIVQVTSQHNFPSCAVYTLQLMPTSGLIATAQLLVPPQVELVVFKSKLLIYSACTFKSHVG